MVLFEEAPLVEIAFTSGLVTTAVEAVKVPPLKVREPVPKGSRLSLPMVNVPLESEIAPE
jgi:hypothetical protein